jgi:predicted enzyme related to lactoylglutathione lyase
MSDTSMTTDKLTPRVHVITLGVEDLQRSLAFYRDGLGLATQGSSAPSSAAMSTRPPERRRCSPSTTG